MATLSKALTLTSTTTSTDALSISLTDTLTVTNPIVDSARVEVTTGAWTELVATSISTITYAYIKNLHATSILNVATGAGSPVIFGGLGPGEFMMYPIDASKGLKLKANTTDIKVEYGLWTKG